MAYAKTTWVNKVTTLGPTNLNNLEDGLEAAATVGDAAVPKSTVTTAGDIIYGTASSTVTRLAIGTARQVLATNSGATAPEWVASLQSLLTATGDTVYASAANTPARLAVGSNGDVLTLASGIPSWAAPAAQEYDVLSKVTTAVTVVNTVTETDLLSYSVGAAAMGTDKRLRAVLMGDYKQNSGATRDIPIWRVKIGSGPTTVVATAVTGRTTTLVNSSQRLGWRIEVEWANLGAADSQWLDFNLEAAALVTATEDGGAVWTTGEGITTMLKGIQSTSGVIKAAGGNASALDTASAQTFAVSVQLPAAHANLDWVMKYAAVEVIG